VTNEPVGAQSVSTLTILKDLMNPSKPKQASKKMEVCFRLCLSVSECDWLWKRTYAYLRRNSLAHGLKWLNQIIKYKVKLWLKAVLENKALDEYKLISG